MPKHPKFEEFIKQNPLPERGAKNSEQTRERGKALLKILTGRDPI